MGDRCLRDFLVSAFPDVFESGIGKVESIDVSRICCGVIAEVEARTASGIENSQIRTSQLASNDRVCDFPHCWKPPVVFFKSVEQFEILLVHRCRVTSSVRGNAESIGRYGPTLLRSGRALSIPSQN